jgi:hypothetical protein
VFPCYGTERRASLGEASPAKGKEAHASKTPETRTAVKLACGLRSSASALLSYKCLFFILQRAINIFLNGISWEFAPFSFDF